MKLFFLRILLPICCFNYIFANSYVNHSLSENSFQEFKTYFPNITPNEIAEIDSNGFDLSIINSFMKLFPYAKLDEIKKLKHSNLYIDSLKELKDLFPQLTVNNLIQLEEAEISIYSTIAFKKEFSEISFKQVIELGPSYIAHAVSLKQVFPQLSIEDLFKLKKADLNLYHAKEFKKVVQKTSIDDLLRLGEAHINIGDALRFKYYFPQTSINDFVLLGENNTDLAQALNFKYNLPQTSFEELAILGKSKINLDHAWHFKSAFPQTSIDELVQLASLAINIESAKIFKLKFKASIKDLIRLGEKKSNILEFISLKEQFPKVSIDDLDHLKESNIDLNRALTVKHSFPQASVEDLFQLGKLKIDIGQIAYLKRCYPEISVEIIINLGRSIIKSLFTLQSLIDKKTISLNLISGFLDKLFKYDELVKILELNIQLGDITKIIKKHIQMGHNSSEYSNNLKFKLLYPELFDSSQTYRPSLEAQKFAHLYILNKMNQEARLAYDGAIKSKHGDEEIKQLFNEWQNRITEQRQFTDKLISPKIPCQKITKEFKIINGVETASFYIPSQFYLKKHRPVLMYIHGGNTQNRMTLDRLDPILDYYSAKGYIVIAPNFREGSELEDIYHVGLEMQKSTEFSINPNQIFITSISAGSDKVFRLLELIKKNNWSNPFSAVHLSTTVADSTFKNRVSNLPQNIPYLIVHGEKDDIANVVYMKDLYDQMVKQGFEVTAYFSPSGNHHLVDHNLNENTPEIDPIYLDLVKWPEYFIPFFKRAKRSHLISSPLFKILQNQLIYYSLFPRKENVKTEDISSLIETNFDKIPSLKYLQIFNRSLNKAGIEDRFSLNNEIKQYYSSLFKIESDFSPTFAQEIISDKNFYNQILNILNSELLHFEESSAKSNDLVAYHATQGKVIGLFYLYSTISSFLKGQMFHPFKFRENNFEITKNDIRVSNPLKIINKMYKEIYKTDELNKIKEYSLRTLSMAPTLFSGDRELSSPIAIWKKSISGECHLDVDSFVRSYLKTFRLDDKRIDEYIDLLNSIAKNGGIYQFFASPSIFDRGSTLAEPLGVELPFELKTSEYYHLLKNNPNALQKKFSDYQFKNSMHWNIFQDPLEKDRLFSIAQIRLISASLFTKRMIVKFYPYDQEGFNNFYKKLIVMIANDAKKLHHIGSKEDVNNLHTQLYLSQSEKIILNILKYVQYDY